MDTLQFAYPAKTRDIHNHHMDSTVWDDLVFRDDDVVVATYGKSGTTWAQQIVSQLIFQGDPSVSLDAAPWVDLRFPPKAEKLSVLEAQTHRRAMKTHLPFDALRVSPKAKYLYIARDGRDVVWSLHNHFFRASKLLYDLCNETPGRVGPPIERPDADIRRYFLEWLERDGYPLWSFWENVRSWLDACDLPNVRLVHFNELKRDLPGGIRAIADFLEIEIDPSRWDTIVEHCTFDYMKANAADIFPLGETAFEGGARTFINKGDNQRWKDVLTEVDSQLYLQAADRELGPRCALWLATGDRSFLTAL